MSSLRKFLFPEVAALEWAQSFEEFLESTADRIRESLLAGGEGIEDALADWGEGMERCAWRAFDECPPDLRRAFLREIQQRKGEVVFSPLAIQEHEAMTKSSLVGLLPLLGWYLSTDSRTNYALSSSFFPLLIQELRAKRRYSLADEYNQLLAFLGRALAGGSPFARVMVEASSVEKLLREYEDTHKKLRQDQPPSSKKDWPVAERWRAYLLGRPEIAQAYAEFSGYSSGEPATPELLARMLIAYRRKTRSGKGSPSEVGRDLKKARAIRKALKSLGLDFALPYPTEPPE